MSENAAQEFRKRYEKTNNGGRQEIPVTLHEAESTFRAHARSCESCGDLDHGHGCAEGNALLDVAWKVKLKEAENLFDDAEPYSGPSDAPWSEVPTALAKRYIRENPDAAIEVIFPTVYEEDRSSKLKDLGTAEAMEWISHQQAQETALQELGYDSANSSDTADQIRREKAEQRALGVPPDNAAPEMPWVGDQEPKRASVATLRQDAREAHVPEVKVVQGDIHVEPPKVEVTLPPPGGSKKITIHRDPETGLIESATVETP
jgi:hypothetical protein